MCAVAAGLRSGLVVDIGWAETIVTAIYEYRECHSNRSVRAMKLLMKEMGRLLNSFSGQSGNQNKQASEGEQEKLQRHVTLEYCEEVATKLAWCRPLQSNHSSTIDRLSNLSVSEGNVAGNETGHPNTNYSYVSIPLSAAPSSAMRRIPTEALADPADRAFFAGDSKDNGSDDNELPLHILIYRALLALPPDMRGTCMSRIIIAGGGSRIPGLKKRIMDELAKLIECYGWDSRRGRLIDSQREKLREVSRNRQATQGALNGDLAVSDPSTQQAKDVIEEKLRRNQSRDAPPSVHGVLRQVESLGPWAGASLVASLRVKGLVEIDRDKFLQHGLAGASRDIEVSTVPQRLSLGPGVQRTGIGDRSSWTLGAWA